MYKKVHFWAAFRAKWKIITIFNNVESLKIFTIQRNSMKLFSNGFIVRVCSLTRKTSKAYVL